MANCAYFHFSEVKIIPHILKKSSVRQALRFQSDIKFTMQVSIALNLMILLLPPPQVLDYRCAPLNLVMWDGICSAPHLYIASILPTVLHP